MKYSIFTFLIVLAFGLSTFSQDRISDTFDTGAGELIISPVLHGTLAMQWNHKTIYNDPYGGKAAFAGLPVPDLILITDIHGDHLNEETLKELDLEKTTIIAPQAVIDQMDDLFKEKTQALPTEKNWFGMKLQWKQCLCTIYLKRLIPGTQKDVAMAMSLLLGVNGSIFRVIPKIYLR